MNFRLQKTVFVELRGKFQSDYNESYVDKWLIHRVLYRSSFKFLSSVLRLKIGLEQPAPMFNQPRSPLLREVYYALVNSYVKYGIIVWGNASETA